MIEDKKYSGVCATVTFHEYTITSSSGIVTSLLLYLDSLMQGCSNSIANAMGLLQSCTKLSICLGNLSDSSFCRTINWAGCPTHWHIGQKQCARRPMDQLWAQFCRGNLGQYLAIGGQYWIPSVLWTRIPWYAIAFVHSIIWCNSCVWCLFRCFDRCVVHIQKWSWIFLTHTLGRKKLVWFHVTANLHQMVYSARSHNWFC